MYNSSSSDKAKTYCMYIGDIERRWTLKETWTAGWFMVSVYSSSFCFNSCNAFSVY